MGGHGGSEPSHLQLTGAVNAFARTHMVLHMHISSCLHFSIAAFLHVWLQWLCRLAHGKATRQSTNILNSQAVAKQTVCVKLKSGPSNNKHIVDLTSQGGWAHLHPSTTTVAVDPLPTATHQPVLLPLSPALLPALPPGGAALHAA